MSKQVQTQEEEIDLGGFFNQIGRLFSKLFAFVGGIFKSLYHLFIITLIFIKNNYIKLGIAIVIGLIMGFVSEKTHSKPYSYDMIVEPNFDGSFQLVERVKYYNQLINNKSYNTLSKVFKIDENEAKSILKFEIKRQEDLKDLYEGYDNFILNKDSITISKITFESFSSKKFSYYNSKRYKLIMQINKPFLNKNIEDQLVLDLENNKNLQDQKETQLMALNEKEKNFLKMNSDIDSLRMVYREASLLSAKNNYNNITSIDLKDNNSQQSNDLDLFKLQKEAFNELERILYEKEKYRNIFIIITPFKPMGVVDTNLLDNKIIQYPIFTFSIVFLILVLLQFNNYLKNYKK